MNENETKNLTHENNSSAQSVRQNEHEKVDEILEKLEQGPAADNRETSTTHKSKNPNLNYWFWGTIAILIVSTIILTFMAQQNISAEKVIVEEVSPANPIQTLQNDLPKELTAGELREIFDNTYEPALKATLAVADELIEAAYEPVYRKIPAYTDWHYSVWGSYVELGTAALDSPEKILEEKLLDGLGERLAKIPNEVTTVYGSQFEKSLNVQLNSFSASGRKIGPLTEIILTDAVTQTGTSVLVFAGGGAFGKVLSTIIIKKVGAKIALKMGSKWAAAAGGATGGAVLCAWAGPAAAVCAAGGGLLTFFGVDAGINYVDKKFTSEDFKSELRTQIDASKQRQKDYFRDQIEQMVKAQKVSVKYNLQDFTLKQLAEADRDSVCAATKVMIEDYEAIQTNLSNRSDENILKLLKTAEASVSKVGLFEISEEIATNLNSFENYILATPTVISGRLPSEYEANRKLSGSITVNNVKYSLDKSSVTSNFVNIPISDEDKKKNAYLTDKNTLRVRAKIEQHRVLRNKHFAGEFASQRQDLLSKDAKAMIKIKVPFEAEDDKTPRVTFPLFLSFSIQAEALARLQMKPECAQ